MLLFSTLNGNSVDRCTNIHLKPTLASTLLAQEPTIKQLANIVLPRIAADWRIVAINLEFELPTIRIIQQRGGSNDPENCCLEMLIKWLTDNKGVGPKTWATLLTALKNATQLTSATQQIEDDLSQLAVTTMQPDHQPSTRYQWWCAIL
ncbi:uncharacterized protein [Dysidea avara]|uniref:uncharacterized protein n=1 Tax=Dysidea avara TaxID=196820 RepID=UPI00332060F3